MGFMQVIDEHPEASLAVLALGAVVVGGVLLKKNAHTATGTANGGVVPSGLAKDANGNPIVYVPTSTSFSTQNIGAQFSNDPSLQSVTTGAITTNSPVTVSAGPVTVQSTPKPPTANPIPTQPHPAPHQPAPAPPARYGLQWGARHSVTSDDTNHGSGALAYIAANSTTIMHTQQHAPSSASISAADIVKHNPGLRTNSLLKVGQTIVLPSWTRV